MAETGGGFWKILAIVLIIVCAIETAYLIWMFSIVSIETEKENKCIVNVCGFDPITFESMKGYDSYYYDTYTGVCYCYLNEELIYQEYVA